MNQQKNIGSTILMIVLIFAFLPSVASSQEATTLDQLLELRDAEGQVTRDTLSLERDWVGDITHEKGQLTKLRLQQGGIREDKVQLYRMRRNYVLGSECPRYIESLPSIGEIRSFKTVAQLEFIFGKTMGFSSGWGDGTRMHSSAGWTFFTKESATKLRYLSVFASISSVKGEKDTRIDRLDLSRGFLRPADMASDAEFKEYPTGEALFLAREAEKKEKRQAYPLPLRDLIATKERPDDSDLIHYRRHLNQIRRSPDPVLFQQIIAEMHEGTVRIRMMLEGILVNSAINGLLELDPWEPERRDIAIQACIDAIPMAKDDFTVRDLVLILLQTKGGEGTIDIKDRQGDHGTRITLRESGYSSGGIRTNVTLEQTQAELKKRLIDEFD